MNGAIRMKANRKVMETSCTSCGDVFKFGDDVYSCPACNGYHHVRCWEAGFGCPGVGIGSAEIVDVAPVAAPPLPETPPAAPPEAPAAVMLAADERPCPVCACAVKKAALKCRFCGAALSAGLAAVEVPPQLAEQVRKLGNQALTFGLVGLCICAPIFGSLAISRGNEANSLGDAYPEIREGRGKAKAGLILGWVDWGLFVIGVLIQLANLAQR